MLKLSRFRAPALLAAALLVPAICAAQGTPNDNRRPYRGLFGGNPHDPTTSWLSVSLSGAYDDNVLPQTASGPVDPRFQESGYLGGLSAQLTLQRAGEKGSFALSATSSMRYYPDKGDLTGASHGALAQAGWQAWAKGNLQVSGGFMYSPLYSAMLATPGSTTPGSLTDPNLETPSTVRWSGDYAVAYRPALVSYGSVQLTQAMTRRLSFIGSYAMNFVDFSDDELTQKRDSSHAGIGYRMTRYSTLRLGYSHTGYQLAETGERHIIHDFESGIDYLRPLSISGRRTTFTVTPGWALAERQGRTHFYATGTATLNHEIGRTWAVQANYVRGVRFIDGMTSEMLANQLATQVDGFLGRRFSVQVGGRFDVSDESSNYKSYAGAARLNYAMSRNLQAFVHYIYYHYRFGPTVEIPDTMSRQLDRQGVRVGITLWAPVLR